MRIADLRPRHWGRSLRTRLVAFLTLALLPLGSIAVLQTVQVINEAARLSERDVLARTERAAGDQEAILRRATGAAYALGTAAAVLRDARSECSALMRDFVQSQPSFVFTGFISADGIMACNSAGETIDYSGRADWIAFSQNPVAKVTVNRNGDASGRSVFIAFVPIFSQTDGTFLGGQAVSLPHGLAETLLETEADHVELALVSPRGEILARSVGMDADSGIERLNIVPERLDIPGNGLLLRPRAEDGRTRPVAVVPLIREHVYVVGLWMDADRPKAVSFLGTAIPAFPVLMWLASILIAFVAVNSLVLRHLNRMSEQMDRYDAQMPEGAFVHLPDAPSEFQGIARSYNRLIERVAADTAALEETVAEKETLLREVHHRVKNNLQLISSILNMQIRAAGDENARRILRRVQDRVMSLSSVHRALYTNTQLTSVRSDLLLSEIAVGVSNIAVSGADPLDVSVDLEPVRLVPDQAVPLSLLATEAMTNAVKYASAAGGAKPKIEMSLTETGAGAIVFRISNTRDPKAAREPEAQPDGTGLGSRLIRSFASQLGGEVELRETETIYDLTVRFERQPLGHGPGSDPE